ncbi:MAG: hypothetical protein AB7K24_02220 [Gemmataceae bacterium]
MAVIAPPRKPPFIALDDGDGMRRIQQGLFLLGWTAATVFLNAWLFTVDLAAGILGLVVAKHVLVAVLVKGLGIDENRAASSGPAPVPLPMSCPRDADES